MTGLALGLIPWLVSGGSLVQHQPFEQALFVRQMFDGGATMMALPHALVSSFIQDGALRDPACKLKRLGYVWSPSQLAAPLPELPDAFIPLFDFYPLGDLAGLPRLRVPGSDPTLLPLGEVLTNGKDGDPARFLEIELGEDRRHIKLRGAMVPRGSSFGSACTGCQRLRRNRLARVSRGRGRAQACPTPTCFILAV